MNFTKSLSFCGYTAETGSQSFGHSSACRCWHFRLHIYDAFCILHSQCKTLCLQAVCIERFTRGLHSSASFTKIMVERLLKVTSEYEERLRRCDPPPLLSLPRKATYNTHPYVRLVRVIYVRARTIVIILTLGLLVLFFLITYQIIIPVMRSSYITSN